MFGAGGLVLRCAVFPALNLLAREPARRTALARYTVHQSFRFFIWLMGALGIYRYRIEGQERLQRPGLLVLANHPTLIDIVFLISLLPNANCIVKASLLRNPFTRGPVQGTGYITNDRQGTDMLQACIDSIRNGDHLVIFPEGTRTRHDARKLHFQRGSANIAVRAVHPVTPVIIRCDQPFLTKGAPWWKIPPQRPNIHIEVLPDLDPKAWLVNTPNEALAARQLTADMQRFFEQEIFRE